MICDSCQRDVDHVKASFWHGDAMICQECFALWCDPNDVYISAGDAASVGNHVRLRHGLPPVAAAVALLLLAGAPTAFASRHCLDKAEAARTWPTRMLVKDDDGCWTYDRHPRRVEVAAGVPETPAPAQGPTLADRWGEASMVQLELAQLEPKGVSEPSSPPGPIESTSQFALFVWLVLAITSVVEIATGRLASRDRRPRWRDRQAPRGFGRG